MDRDTLIWILRKNDVLRLLACGPVVLTVSNRKKRCRLRVRRQGESVIVRIGRLFCRRVEIPVSALQK